MSAQPAGSVWAQSTPPLARFERIRVARLTAVPDCPAALMTTGAASFPSGDAVMSASNRPGALQVRAGGLANMSQLVWVSVRAL
jgi:hypothetical protein